MPTSAGCLDRLGHFHRLGGIGRQRLLAEHVLAGGDRRRVVGWWTRSGVTLATASNSPQTSASSRFGNCRAILWVGAIGGEPLGQDVDAGGDTDAVDGREAGGMLGGHAPRTQDQ